MCLGTNVCGHNRVWAQSCVGTNVYGHKRVWAQSCVGTNVSGHKRVWAQSCVGTIMCGHNRVWAQTCLGTIVCGHNRVGPIVWAQSCMGPIVVEPFLSSARLLFPLGFSRLFLALAVVLPFVWVPFLLLPLSSTIFQFLYQCFGLCKFHTSI